MNEQRQQQIEKLAELIKDVHIAMFTTQRPDGRLVSRPVATQDVEFDGDLWFATAGDSPKIAEIAANPRVNISYASQKSNVYVSVAGNASVSRDREKIEKFWSPALKIYFPNGKDDPNLVLVKVDVESAEYWDGPGGGILGQALYFVVASINDDPGAMTENRLLDLRNG